MKIGILTLPLNTNYGGIVQAYALKRTLENMGHEAIMIDHVFKPKLLPLKVRYLIYFKRSILKYIFRKRIIVRYDKYCQEIYNYKRKEIIPFIDKYISKSEFNVGSTNTSHLDAIIVGSDQVWRPAYANPIKKYFLYFVNNNDKIRKIAYAASFGTDIWEFTPQQTEECAQLVKSFDLITVREDSAIVLCREHFGVNAEHVLDPTMLLDKEDYIKIAETDNAPVSSGNLFAYILDDTIEKQNYVSDIGNKSGLVPFSIMPTDKQLEQGESYPAVSVWLRAFMDAQFVVTDSFHGCVFSIIFNKPFIAIGNADRGKARFDSLFRLFRLENRLVTLSNLSMEPLYQMINWNEVNAIREQMKEKSFSLLNKNLK